MTFWRQALEIARVDLTVESRVGNTIRITLPFAVVALMVFPLALGLQLGVVSATGLGVFWAIGILFGMQVALRQSASDTRERRDLQALLGVDPAARFVGRLFSGGLLMVGFLLTMLVAMAVLFDPDIPQGGWPVLVLSTLLVAIGLTELGTLAGEITTGLSHRTVLASLIVAPLALPLVIGASQSVEALQRDTGILAWILLLIASDLALAVAGVALARPLEKATR
ncbi:MAG TPA: heme exporter protein CcmB [Acidimicrobiia bacterium]|nr:heme exporter protein CcmB [Acidimicrobiia bacterium]